MIVGPEDWQQLWDVIEDEFSQSTEKTISVLFSVQEVETVCAIKLLQVGLKIRNVHFSVYPVEDYSQLRRSLSNLLEDSKELRTVFLVNCGAAQYAKDLAPKTAVNVRFVVIDSHRPIHPKYNDADDSDSFFVLAADDPQQRDEIPVRDECDNIDEEGYNVLIQQAEEEQQREEEELEAAGSPSPAKRPRLDEQSDKRQHRDQLKRLRDRQKLVREYFDMGSYYGKPTPLVLQPLVEALAEKLDNRILWPACVGLMDQWVHQRLSSQHYALWYQQLKEAVMSNDANQSRANQANNDGRLSSSSPVIATERDYRLFLPRYSTLWTSFIYSPYVAPRLQTWRRAGEESLALILAQMGISKEQAETAWGSMHRSAHTRFREGLKKSLESSNLAYDELVAEGFVLHHNRQITGASDVVHAVTALLTEHSVLEAQSDGQASAAFWAALEALDAWSTNGYAQLHRGIDKAKLMQEAIIRDGGLLVTDRKLVINRLSHIQELLLHLAPPTNAREFRHPLTLLRLAHFVKDATRVARKAQQMRVVQYPILAVGPEDPKGYCLAIGLRAALLPDKPQYNIFGRSFKEVLENMHGAIDWDSSRDAFDSAVVYVHKASMKVFTIELRRLLKQAAEEGQRAAEQFEQTQQQQQQQGTQQQQQQPDDANSDGSSRGGSGQAGHDGGGAEKGDGDEDGSLAATDDADDDAGGNADLAAADAVPASDDEEDQEDDAQGENIVDAENLEDDF